eukprot:11207551-Lingulodinium_polyedra.AAC.1
MTIAEARAMLQQTKSARAAITVDCTAATSLDKQIAEIHVELNKRKPLGQRADDLRAVIARTEKRITEAKNLVAAATATLDSEQTDLEKYQAELMEVEVNQGTTAV